VLMPAPGRSARGTPPAHPPVKMVQKIKQCIPLARKQRIYSNGQQKKSFINPQKERFGKKYKRIEMDNLVCIVRDIFFANTLRQSFYHSFR
jgi:hypothetical protein